jgi:hypothetical protein
MRRRQGESGSVLMLVPAGILVLLVLGAIAVDSAVVFLAQRDLANRTAAAANDIAGAAVSDEAFYTGGAIVVPEGVADAFVDVSFSAARRPAGFESWSADARTVGRSVTVSAEAEVRYLFAPAVPGAARTTTVRARSTAVAVGG